MKNVAELARAALPEAARGKPLEIWFQDEARVGRQGTLPRLRAQRTASPGTEGLPLRLGLHLRRRLPRPSDRRSARHALRQHEVR